MKLPVKIVLINLGAVILFALFMNFAARDSFALWFGIVSFCIGSLDIFVGLILLVVQDKRYAQGFLISGGVLVLVGFATCTSAL